MLTTAGFIEAPPMLLTTLQRDGLVRVPGLSATHVEMIVDALLRRPRYAGHVTRDGSPAVGAPISCWHMHDLITGPWFWEWALAWTPVAEAYLEAEPRLYSMNAFESTPSEWAPHPGIELFHRDADDKKFLALFVYLTDVQPGDGSHLYQCGTHHGPMTRLEEVVGPKGTTFLADTRGLHRGCRPTTGPRRLAWARWGVSDPPASYVRDRLTPVPRHALGPRYPTDPVLQRIVKLVAA